jgi:hypothetical protein
MLQITTRKKCCFKTTGYNSRLTSACRGPRLGRMQFYHNHQNVVSLTGAGATLGLATASNMMYWLNMADVGFRILASLVAIAVGIYTVRNLRKRGDDL